MGERDQRSESMLHELGALVAELKTSEDIEVLIEVARRLVRSRPTRDFRIEKDDQPR